MKRTLIFALLAILTTIMAWGQTTGADIDAIQQQLNEHITQRPNIAARLDAQDKKAADIKFVYDAWKKQSDKYTEDLSNYNAQSNSVKREYDLLAPALENYNQRVTQHNAKQCTEKCTNGSCDGSCGWYTAEKNQLDANQAQLQQAYAPLEARTAELATNKSYLDQTAEKLDTISAGLQKDIPAWKEAEAGIKAEWDANEVEIKKLQAALAELKGENAACFAKIPPACQINPLLDDECEQMHAACGKMFDGNR